MNTHMFGENQILSFNIDFCRDVPLISIELFNPIERKEIILKYDLTNINMKRIEEQMLNRTNNYPLIRFSQPEKRNINIDAVFKQANVNNL